jgi:O-antigen/teichoic acid export membrane protein
MALLTPVLVNHFLTVPSFIRLETLNSFYLLSVVVPIVLSTAALRGFLEGYQRFDLISLVRVPMSLFSYLGPLLVLPFSTSLVPVILVLVAGRFITWGLHMLQCVSVMPSLCRNITFRGAPIGAMFRFGGWMTVTNVIYPFLVTMDRFFIGALVSIAAVAYYVTPYEVVTKLWFIPGAVVGVLFPAFSTALAQDRHRATILFEKGVKYIFVALFPVVLVMIAGGHLGLQLWLGTDFAEKSTAVLQWLTFGVFMNSLAQIPYWQIQGAGRPDLTAKLHLIELPLYLLTFWFLTRRFGIQGAAVAWTLRVTLDSIVVFTLALRLLPESTPDIRRFFLMLLGASSVFSVTAILGNMTARAGFIIVVFLVFLPLTWFRLLTSDERSLLRNPIKLFAVPEDSVGRA